MCEPPGLRNEGDDGWNGLWCDGCEVGKVHPFVTTAETLDVADCLAYAARHFKTKMMELRQDIRDVDNCNGRNTGICLHLRQQGRCHAWQTRRELAQL